MLSDLVCHLCHRPRRQAHSPHACCSKPFTKPLAHNKQEVNMEGMAREGQTAKEPESCTPASPASLNTGRPVLPSHSPSPGHFPQHAPAQDQCWSPTRPLTQHIDPGIKCPQHPPALSPCWQLLARDGDALSVCPLGQGEGPDVSEGGVTVRVGGVSGG